MTSLSIVIVNWNTRQYLQACLGSIRSGAPGFPFETIVVDNASADGSGEMVRREFPDVRLIENKENTGFAAANNQGARAASGRFLLFLNPDTQVHPGTLAGAVAFMEQHPEAGIMGCRTMNPDGSLQATAFASPTQLRTFAVVSGLNRFFKLSRFSDHSRLRTPDYVQGSFLIIKKALFDDCGRFDERFFLYAEDVDLCLRIKAAGFRIYYYPAVSITHYGGGSSRDSLLALEHHMESLKALFQKCQTPAAQNKLRRVLKAALRLRYFLGAVFSPREFRARKETLKKMLHDPAPADGAEAPGP